MRGPRRVLEVRRLYTRMAADVAHALRPPRALARSRVAALRAGARPSAQAKDAFVRALIDLSQAAAARPVGDEGPALQASLEAMADGLAEWDAARSRASRPALPAPSRAPRPPRRRRCAPRWPPRISSADASPTRWRSSIAAVALDPSFVPVHLLRGLGLRARQPAAAAAAAYARARASSILRRARAAYLYLRATREAAAAAASGHGPGGAGRRPSQPASPSARPRPRRRAARPARRRVGGRAALPAGVLRRRRSRLLAQAQVCGGAGEPARGSGRSARDRALASPGARARPRSANDARGATQAASARRVVRGPAAARRPRIGRSRTTQSLEHLRAAARLNPATSGRGAQADVLVASGSGPRARPAQGRAFRIGQAQWRLGRLRRTGDEAGARLERCGDAVAGASVVHAAIGRLQHTRARSRGRRAQPTSVASTLTPPVAPRTSTSATVYRAQDRLEDALVEYLRGGAARSRRARAPSRPSARCAPTWATTRAPIAMLRRPCGWTPDHREARYALGRALLRLGRAEEARRELAAFEQHAEGGHGRGAPPVRRERARDRARAARRAGAEGPAPRTCGGGSRHRRALCALAVVAMPAPRAQSARARVPAAARRVRGRGQGRRASRSRTSTAPARRSISPRRWAPAPSFFDFDADGWVDVFLVDGGSIADRRRSRPRAAPAVPQPRRRHVRGRHGRVRHPARATTAWARAPATSTTTAASISTSPATAPTRSIATTANGAFTDVTRAAGVGAGALEHQLRVSRRGSRRRSRPVRRQLPRRAEDEQQVLRRPAAPDPRLLPSAELQGPGRACSIATTARASSPTSARPPASRLTWATVSASPSATTTTTAGPTCSWPTTPCRTFSSTTTGGGRFTEVGLAAGVSVARDGKPRAGMGTEFADYNGDGRLDLVVTNHEFETHSLFRNDGARPLHRRHGGERPRAGHAAVRRVRRRVLRLRQQRQPGSVDRQRPRHRQHRACSAPAPRTRSGSCCSGT